MRLTFVSSLLLMLALAAPTNAASPRGKLVIFGESTSDTSNTWILTGQEIWDPRTWNGDPATLPTEPVPPLYAKGRWSNGPMWVEWLSKILNGKAVIPSLDGGLNYAFTDARVGGGTDVRFSVWTGEVLPPPEVASIGAQIRTHAREVGHIERRQLAVLWVGANDVIFSEGPESLVITVRKIRRHIRQLVALGAKHVLVPNQIDPSAAPFFAALSDEERKALRQATIGFNALLRSMLRELQHDFGHHVTLYPVDFFSVGESLFAGCFGKFDAATPAALVYLQELAGPEPKPLHHPLFDRFVFWDTIHPTAAMHKILGRAAAQFIKHGTVPGCG